MDLLLDNLKNVFLRGKDAKTKVGVLPEQKLLIRMGLIGGLSFLVGRVALCYSLEPAAVALMAVLMTKSKANLYALPLVVVGMITSFGTSYNYISQMVTLVLCTVVFFFLGTKRMEILSRALLVTGLYVVTKTVYLLFAGLFFLFDGATIALELFLLLVYLYTFWSFFSLLEHGRSATDRNPVETLAVITIIIMTAFAGIGIYQFGPVSMLHLVSLFFTLWIGHQLGATEGGMVGILTGLFTMIAAYETPALIGILGASGLVAGLVKGQRRVVAGVCFSGMALSFGLLKGFPDLYLSVFEPILVSILYIVVPPVLLGKASQWLSAARQGDPYFQLSGRQSIREQLTGYQDVFEQLALSCGAVGTFNPTRDIVAQQFKGMARAVGHIVKDLAPKAEPILPQKPKYKLSLGISAYAREGRISGDSYLCRGIKEGEYVIALSDGMGRGLRAAEESSLTVNTLYQLMKAGFEAELALRMINSILLLRSTDEIFSTVDMGFVNLFTGRAKFFKIGAAASFIKRGGEVRSIKVSSLPMGIIERVPVETINIQLRKGDQVIIVSDGITEADRGENGLGWIKDTIKEIRSKDPQTMADLIVNRAIQQYGIKEKDDMTVIAFNVN